jgi:hypothetical protein
LKRDDELERFREGGSAFAREVAAVYSFGAISDRSPAFARTKRALRESIAMTVAELISKLAELPPEAVVLMESDGGLSRVSALEFLEGQGPGAPAEVILTPSMDE